MGWVSAIALLLAYVLVTRDPADAAGRRYPVLNLIGSTGLAVSGTAHAAWPSVALNVLWLAVGLATLNCRRWPLSDDLG